MIVQFVRSLRSFIKQFQLYCPIYIQFSSKVVEQFWNQIFFWNINRLAKSDVYLDFQNQSEKERILKEKEQLIFNVKDCNPSTLNFTEKWTFWDFQATAAYTFKRENFPRIY